MDESASDRLAFERSTSLPLPLVLGQEPLAQPDGLRRDLDELVLGDELERRLERERPRRREQRDYLVRIKRLLRVSRSV